MRRPRGPGGRFLTAAEVAELERKEREAGGDKGKVDGGSQGGSETTADNPK
jgi:hypothetical protein